MTSYDPHNDVPPADPGGEDESRLFESRVSRNGTHRTILQRVDATKETAADQLLSTAERVRAEAFRSGDDVAIHYAQQLSRRLERAAMYLHGHTLDQITDDATQVVQSKPWQAVMIAFVVGVIFGRSFQRNA